MMWDFFDDDFWDNLEDIAISSAVVLGIVEEEEEERLRRQLEEDADEDSNPY